MGIRKNKSNRLAQDLTLVLMRENGSPRAFRIRVPALIRSLLSLGGTLLVLGLGTIALIVVLIWHNRSFVIPRIQLGAPSSNYSSPAPSPAPRPVVADTSGNALDAIPAPDSVLKEELLKVQRELEDRKSLAPGSTSSQIAMVNAPIQLLSAASSLLPLDQVKVEVKNLRTRRDGSSVYLDFDLQNTDPTQKQIRGYIVVLAKTPSSLYTYPEQVLSPKDNILLNFGKGETFAISRFRQASAKFSHIPTDSGPVNFQVFLFGSDGKILISSHIEGK